MLNSKLILDLILYLDTLSGCEMKTSGLWPLSLLLPLAWSDLPPSPCQAGASLCFCSSNEMEKSFNVYCPDPAHTELTITLRQHSAPVISFT